MRISKHKLYLAIVDVLIFNIAFILAYYINFFSGLRKVAEDFPKYYVFSIVLFSLLIPIFFQLLNLYKYQMIVDRARQASAVLKGYIEILLCLIALIFLTKTQYIVQSRVTIGLGFLIGFLLTAVIRCFLIRWVYFILVKKEKVGKRALIVGTGEEARQLQQGLDSSNESYFRIVGFCDSDPSGVGQKVGDYLILGTVDQIEEMIHRYQVEEILIASSDKDHVPILKIIDQCKEAGCVIHVISDLYKVVTDKLESEVFGNLRTFRIASSQNGVVLDGVKRTLDLAGSTLLLILLSPVFLILSILIKLDSSGPVFYKRKVVGKDQKEFTFYKFRTMFADNDDSIHKSFMKDFIQGNEKTHDTFYVRSDPRITRVGKYLRKYSLDEFPQLFNVFLGEMSLVGPRPANTDEVQHYKGWHKKRFQVKPGMTGLWQVHARSEIKYDDMVAIDLYYIENRSLWLDLEILFQTIPTVLFGRGSRI
jgi:exopolysaccharide biosynthesis polyprenyl glycosylphosphotransferase